MIDHFTKHSASKTDDTIGNQGYKLVALKLQLKMDI